MTAVWTCLSSSCFLKVLQRLNTTWRISLLPEWPLTPCAEIGASLSKSVQRQDLRVPRNVLVEPAEITFNCSTVSSLFSFCLETKKKQWNRNWCKTRGEKADILYCNSESGCVEERALLSSTISHCWIISTAPASWDLPQMGERNLTTNYTWETMANKPNSKLLTPRKCLSLPHNNQLPPSWIKFNWMVYALEKKCLHVIFFHFNLHHYLHTNHVFFTTSWRSN